MLNVLFGGNKKKKNTRRGLPPHPPGYEENEGTFINSSHPQQQIPQPQLSQFSSQGLSNTNNFSQYPDFGESSFQNSFIGQMQNYSQNQMHSNSSDFQIEQIIEYAKQLFAQGYSEPQVVNELRRQGISFQTIDYVMKEILRNNVTSNQNFMENENYDSFSFDMLTPKIREISDQGYKDMEEEIFKDYGEYSEESGIGEEEYDYNWKDVDKLEEIVEAVLEDRLKYVLQKISELEIKIKNIESEFEETNDKIENIKKNHENDINSVKNSISDIIERIDKLEPKLNGFEKAFKDIVPDLVDEVKELKEIINLKIKRDEKMKKITL